MGRFKLADGGTLFLDEIATIPTNLQAKLLRVLERGEFEPVGSSKTTRVDVRVLSATNADLGKEVNEGRFRQDLLYRLNTVQIHVPALRERKEDIDPLAMHFLGRHTARYRKHITGFDPTAMETLLNYFWPGNVRELDHTVERAVLMAEDEVVRVNDLGLEPRSDSSLQLEQMTLEQAERKLIEKTMSRLIGDITKAAKALGLSRSALYRRLKIKFQRFGNWCGSRTFCAFAPGRFPIVAVRQKSPGQYQRAEVRRCYKFNLYRFLRAKNALCASIAG